MCHRQGNTSSGTAVLHPSHPDGSPQRVWGRRDSSAESRACVWREVSCQGAQLRRGAAHLWRPGGRGTEDVLMATGAEGCLCGRVLLPPHHRAERCRYMGTIVCSVFCTLVSPSFSLSFPLPPSPLQPALGSPCLPSSSHPMLY